MSTTRADLTVLIGYFWCLSYFSCFSISLIFPLRSLVFHMAHAYHIYVTSRLLSYPRESTVNQRIVFPCPIPPSMREKDMRDMRDMGDMRDMRDMRDMVRAYDYSQLRRYWA